MLEIDDKRVSKNLPITDRIAEYQVHVNVSEKDFELNHGYTVDELGVK